MTSNEPDWFTAITEVEPNRIRLRGYRLDELMGQVTFTEAIHLIFTAELPSPEAAKLLDAILVSSIDHGATPPSTLAARTAASTGAPANAAVAAGLLSINRHHGGAVEACMELLHEVLELRRETGADLDQAATLVVDRLFEAKRRLPGLGHRLHSADPRASRLFELARKLGVAADGVATIGALQQRSSERLARDLPINVDGAIAALLVDLGLPSSVANALFMIARVSGLFAHAAEETARESPMRRIDPGRHGYDGPGKREVPRGPNAHDMKSDP